MQGVCVVVSTYNRRDLLPGLVAALRAQSHPDVEVAIVDNGSTDGTWEVLQELVAGEAGFRPLRIDDNRGPARARNLAWRSTDREWIAFTDDDCRPSPGWVGALLAAAERGGIVQGATRPDDDTGARPGWFDRSQRIERWSGFFETCNLLVARALLEDLDGFDERFPVAMCEDTDLGLRAVARGAPTAFAADAEVRHHVWREGYRGFLRHRRRFAESVVLIRLNPDARGLLRWGFVVRDVHLAVWALVPLTVGSVALGAGWVPLAAVGAWCARNAYTTRHRPFSFARRFAWSAAQFTGSAYETWCFARASARYRTLVV